MPRVFGVVVGGSPYDIVLYSSQEMIVEGGNEKKNWEGGGESSRPGLPGLYDVRDRKRNRR